MATAAPGAETVAHQTETAMTANRTTERGWLDLSLPLRDDEAVAASLGPPHKASTTVSTLTRFAAKVSHRQRD